jgi:hypothetical protein
LDSNFFSPVRLPVFFPWLCDMIPREYRELEYHITSLVYCGNKRKLPFTKCAKPKLQVQNINFLSICWYMGKSTIASLDFQWWWWWWW